LHLEIEYQDGSREVRHKTAEVWKNTDQRVLEIPLQDGKMPVKLTLGGKTIPDAQPKDNVWKER
ncbi:MAG: hypothetical protein SFV22_17250, partial [Saprospiraceae bacterium]|nr:hypothetical protein [Saprospiraceae bacterium]